MPVLQSYHVALQLESYYFILLTYTVLLQPLGPCLFYEKNRAIMKTEYALYSNGTWKLERDCGNEVMIFKTTCSLNGEWNNSTECLETSKIS